MTDLVLKCPPKAQSQVISQLLHEKVEENKLKDSQTASSVIQLSQPQGRPMNVTVSKTRNVSLSKSPMLSHNDMLAMKNNMNLSNRETIKMAASIRTGTKNRKAIESGLKRKLSIKAHSVDAFFSHKEFPLVHIKGNQVSNAPVIGIYCTNVQEFIKHVREERNVSKDHLKLGIDGGGGFLKICLSMQATSHMKPEFGVEDKKRTKYSRGIIYSTKSHFLFAQTTNILSQLNLYDCF